MKNIITLNIGLVTSEATGKRPLNADRVCATAAYELDAPVSRVARSESATEPTLVLEIITADALTSVLSAVAVLSDLLEQDCIAVHAVAEDGTASGHLVGDKAEAWSPFNPALFLTLDGRTLADVGATPLAPA